MLKRNNMKKAISIFIEVLFYAFLLTCGYFWVKSIMPESEETTLTPQEVTRQETALNEYVKKATDLRKEIDKQNEQFTNKLQENEKTFQIKDSTIIRLDTDATIMLLSTNLSRQDSTWSGYNSSDNSTPSKTDKQDLQRERPTKERHGNDASPSYRTQ